MGKINVSAGDFMSGKFYGRTFDLLIERKTFPFIPSDEKIDASELAECELLFETSASKSSVAAGLAGAALAGPVGLLAGLAIGGKPNQVAFTAAFNDGRKLIGTTDANTFLAMKAVLLAPLSPPEPAPPPPLSRAERDAVLEKDIEELWQKCKEQWQAFRGYSWEARLFLMSVVSLVLTLSVLAVTQPESRKALPQSVVSTASANDASAANASSVSTIADVEATPKHPLTPEEVAQLQGLAKARVAKQLLAEPTFGKSWVSEKGNRITICGIVEGRSRLGAQPVRRFMSTSLRDILDAPKLKPGDFVITGDVPTRHLEASWKKWCLAGGL